MIVAPITAPRIRKINEAKVCAWIPEGFISISSTIWCMKAEESWNPPLSTGPLETIPVLVKAGGVDSYDGQHRGRRCYMKKPETLRIRIFGGADGAFYAV